jgi:hypothetical protein
MLKHNANKVLLLIFTMLLVCASEVVAQDISGGASAPRARRTFRLQFEVTAGADKVEGAQVRLESAEAGVDFTKEFRTNRQGAASASAVPEGRLKIQVVAKECDTFGEFINLAQDNQTIRVALNKKAPTPSPGP